MSTSPNATQTAFRERLSRSLLLGWISVFFLLFIVVIASHAWIDYRNFVKAQHQLMSSSLSSTVRQLKYAMDSMYRGLELFAADERVSIASLHRAQSQETIAREKLRLESQLSVLFQGPYDFYVTDLDQKLLFSSQISLEVVDEDAPFMGCPNSRNTIEIVSTWSHKNKMGIFAVCESLESLAQLLEMNKTSHFDLLLTNSGLTNIILDTRQDTHISHSAYASINQADRERIVTSTAIAGGPWQLAILPKPHLFYGKARHLIIQTASLLFVFSILVGLLLFTLQKVERKRKEAVAEWQNLQRRAQVTLASVADGVVVTNNERQVQYMNPRAEQITGWRMQEALSLPLEMICPIDEEALSTVTDNRATEKNPKRFTVTLKKGHKKLIIEQSATPLIAEDGGEPGLVWVLRDVTRTYKILRELTKNEKQYRLLADNVRDVIWTFNLKLELKYLSPSIEGLTGYSLQECFSADPPMVIAPQDRLKLRTLCHQLITNAEEPNAAEQEIIELQAQDRSGNRIWLEVCVSLMRKADGNPVGILGIARDITERRASEAEIRLSAIVFENSFEGIMITDGKGMLVRVNKAFTNITGYLPEEAVGTNASLLQSGKHSPEFYREMWHSLETFGYWHGEIWNARKNGDVYPQRLSISAIKDRDQKQVVNYVGIFADITDRKETEERIHRLAYYDELSNLPNRVLFQERLKRAMIHAKRNKHHVGLLFVDLDRFKSINDTMGHPCGDELLKLAAERLKGCVREEDTVARMGGDEFTLILVGMQPEKASFGTAKVAEKVLKVVSEPYVIDGREVYVGASVGIAIYPQQGKEPMELVKNADMALYKAKAEGRNNFQYYSQDMNATAVNRLELENDLRRALPAGEFKIYYQPQVCVETGKLCGVEALLRWYSPKRGLVSPSEFIPVLEETGLILSVGEWSLEAACSQAVAWRQQGLSVPKLAVNLSARQFTQPKLVEQIAEVLYSTGLNPSCLEVELTESVLMEDIDATSKKLSKLKAMGVAISIDDFGTGYSSLNYLKRFPLDKLKIDRSFVRDITVNVDDAEVIAAIIAIAHNLKLGVIAEGVETWGQLEFLRFHRCNQAQGYLISRPITAKAMADFLKQGESRLYPEPA